MTCPVDTRRAPASARIGGAADQKSAGHEGPVSGSVGRCGKSARRRRGRGRGRKRRGVAVDAASAARLPGAKETQPAALRSGQGDEKGKYEDLYDDAKRAAWAERMGYKQIGKPVPDEVSLHDVIKTFPSEVYQLDHGKAWWALFTTISAIWFTMTLVAVVPWYLKPMAWFLAGTASTGLFVLGHECGHRIFHRAVWVNDLVGHMVMTPLIFPYHPWRLIHALHHQHTNKLEKDTGWHPIMEEEAKEAGVAFGVGVRAVLGTPLKLWLSLFHWIHWHFSFEKFPEYQKKHQVYMSWGLVAAFAGIVWPWLIVNHGFRGFLDFWLMPWLGYHFWMSTFTLVHHTAPHIPFRSEEEYHPARAKLGGTVNCEYPKWVETLTHDINIHIPHHLSSRIPFYNLRAATDSLRQNWGQHLTECRFNWRLVRNFLTEIHLYAKDNSYIAFDADGKEESFLALQRRAYPDTM